ncbi:MAG: RDD family protein [Turicibacter sp.]|nr:RDD family protein [Turicibacter sp.]
MKIYSVLTPANIEVEYRLAGAGSRLAAFVIDFTIQLIICLLLAIIILFGIYSYTFATLDAVEGFALSFLIVSVFFVYFCYFIIFEMILTGQTPGKKIFGLRVISDNGQPVSLSQSLVRNLFKAVLDIIYIGIIVIMFSEKHKRLGDMVAGTIVVAEHYEPIPLRDRSGNFSNVSSLEQFKHLQLTQEEVDLLHIYEARKIYLPDYAKSELVAEWASYLAKKWNIDANLVDDELLVAVLKLND